MNNKNKLATTTGTGVALKNASKSLKITNKLLAEVDDFEKHWDWWLSLDDEWRTLLLFKGLELDDIYFDWFDKNLMKNYIRQILQLAVLLLEDNRISDISALAHLTNLTKLNLWKNQISDISILSNLTGLTELNLGSNPIDDFSALSNLTNLTELSLSFNEISDISSLANLTNLIKLDLYSNEVSDISTLSNLTDLTELNLGANLFE